MPEEMFVRHCCATMAGIKTGNLFSCPNYGEREVREFVRTINRKLCSKGMRTIMMSTADNRCLVYSYRPKLLEQDLSDFNARQKLSELGYCCDNQAQCVALLAKKIKKSSTFPHEIGFFLGYPSDDVLSFIKNDKCAQCTGCWKVYHNKEKAEKTFEKYKKCEKVYYENWKKGSVIERLTVSA